MARLCFAAVLTLAAIGSPAQAYIEAPHSLGQIIQQSTHIMLVEVARLNTDKNLIIYKKIRDIKGTHPQAEVKHNIGRAGFHPREWQTIMKWAAVGKKALFFHNGGAGEVCLDRYWYQIYPGGEWWNMSHAEPFLLRTFYGSPEKLADAVTAILAGREVVVTCLADGNKNDLHLARGKIHRLRASLKRANYDARRDFVALGGDGEDIPEIRSLALLRAGADGWRYLPARQAGPANAWYQPDFNDGGWRTGKAPIGYGEPEIVGRKGTTIPEQGQPFVFRRVVEVPADVLAQKEAAFRLGIASDNCATVYLNGALVDQESTDHEFSYWSRDLELKREQLRPGRNVLAVQVNNTQGSSDLYLDAELTAEITLPPRPKTPAATAVAQAPTGTPAPAPLGPEPERPGVMTIDRARRAVVIEAQVAPRKLPNLQEVYPIEVIATWPAPRGQKAHETVVVYSGLRPSTVQKALMELGLKPGKPARGEGAKAEGPVVIVQLEFPDAAGKIQRVPVEKLLLDGRTKLPLPPLTWHFTGSALKQPDPEKDDRVPGADLTGTLIGIFPVTDDTIVQSSLTLKEEAMFKLEVIKDLLPAEGKPIKLVIQPR